MSRLGSFGEQRLLKTQRGLLERLLYRVLGIADPAHYLHARYLIAALDRLGNFSPRAALDAGCGRGDYSFYLARRYPQCSVVGVDIDRDTIERNRETARELGLTNVSFRWQSILDLRADSSFDLIVSIDVLEHIVPQDRAFRALAGALADRGVAFYHIPTRRSRPVPLAPFLKSFHDWAEREHIAEERTANEFADEVRKSGLQVVEIGPTFGRYSGELANSLFVLPHRASRMNSVLQAVLSPACRLLASLDPMTLNGSHYAVALISRKERAVIADAA